MNYPPPTTSDRIHAALYVIGALLFLVALAIGVHQ